MNSKVSNGLLDTIVNQYLELDPEVSTKLTAFEGRIIAIEVAGFDRCLYLFPVQGRLQVKQHFDGTADTVLRGSPSALFRMGLSKNVAPLMLSGEIDVSGDVRLGREFKQVLGEIDIDWEEQLSGLLGDVAANQLMRLSKRLSHWGKRSADSIIADVSEYLQEESRDVVSAAELDGFYTEVDSLRNDVDRLDARLAVLKNTKQDK